jgi:predicted phosphate transport protein (TIGR00153 family)
LVQIATNVEDAAKHFAQGLNDLSNPAELAAAIKQYETRGDDLTGELVTLLNATYITPLDREDFLELALHMDDIVDGMEACTVRFDLYDIHEATPTMLEFARNIAESVQEITAAMKKLEARKLLDLREHTIRLNQLEKDGDGLLRASLRTLFTQEMDVLQVIKMKEIYEILESITDKCEDVGDVLDSVIVKNA